MKCIYQVIPKVSALVFYIHLTDKELYNISENLQNYRFKNIEKFDKFYDSIEVRNHFVNQLNKK